MSVRARRRQVAYAIQRGLSQRRACWLLSVARSALGYQSRLASRDAPVIKAMSELARQYPRYGYRRIQVMLARQGYEMSAERTYRLWRQAQLQVPRRRPRRRIATAILDRLLHHSHVLNIKGRSYRLRDLEQVVSLRQ